MSVEFQGIFKSFDGKSLLEDFSATIQIPGITCLMGPSGCGKTTLMRMLCGLEVPDSGHILNLDGIRVSAVFQEDRLLDWYSDVDNVAIVLPGPREQARGKARALLREVGLPLEPGASKVSHFSGGMRRRVSIARALAVPFDLLILDEPFSGLDAKAVASLTALLLERCRDKGLLIITHSQSEAHTFGGVLYRIDPPK